MEVDRINNLVLAYMGDAVYEQKIRERLIRKGLNKVQNLQQEALSYVSAINQAQSLKRLIDDNLLTVDEIDVIMRARNSKVRSKPKNVDILTYKHASGLEALVGYLYFKNDNTRIDKIIDIIMGEI